MEIISAIFGAIFAIFKSTKMVQEGELGIKLTFGRASRDRDNKPRVISPGFVFLIPLIQSLRKHHIRQQTHQMSNQRVMIEGGLTFNVSAVVMLRVKDIYKALFEIENLDHSVVDLSMGVLREVLTHKKLEDLSDLQKISQELLAGIREKAEEWGVEFIQFKLTNCAPTPETASLVNAKAGVKMKIEALKEALGGENYKAINPALAAALIGVPLVTSIMPDDLATIQATQQIQSIEQL